MNTVMFEVSPKEQHLLAALEKMQTGQRLYEEGREELRRLTGSAVKSAAKKAVANKTVRRTRRASVDKGVLDQVMSAIRSDRWATTLSLASKTDTSTYTVQRAIDTLRKAKRIEPQWRKGNPAHTDPRSKARLFRYWNPVA